jgi:hypothetical protein
MPRKPRQINGDDLLYRFFDELFREDDPALAHMPVRMLRTMGVWLPHDIYGSWPILLPWVVRDPTCRRSGDGERDEWSSPNDQGYLRDDNSLIKKLPRALAIDAGGQRHLHRARMGTEFVAAHVWRTCTTAGVLATQHPLLNSFVPNLVWLPRQVAKLTDREGSLVQRTLQALAWRIYRSAPVAPHLQDAVDAAWELLTEPEIELPPLDFGTFNWFVPTGRFFQHRDRSLATVVEALRELEAGRQPELRVITTRYAKGLPKVGATARANLLRRLETFSA